MLNQATLARPYARAAFEAASGAGAQARWSTALATGSAILGDGRARGLVHDPRVAQDQVLEMLMAVGGDAFDGAFENFLRTLLHYDRVDLLPEIAAQFEVLRAEAERRIRVRVASAVALDEDQKAQLSERLKARLGRDIDLENEIDPELVAGLVIRAGDQVIDGSVRGRLNRLAQQFID